MYLYIDTTDKITLGLLSEKFEWIDYFFDPKIVISTKLHLLINQILEKNGVELNEIKSTIYMAGPGSYTGMRVSEGIAQIFEWQNLKVNSLYHFEVPLLAGVKEGRWIAKAFKGELFIYSWTLEDNNKKLIPEEQLSNYLKENHNFQSRDHLEIQSQSTAQMIKEAPSKILKTVIENNMKRELFYFREIAQEFKKC